jgi:hypothetical protein
VRFDDLKEQTVLRNSDLSVRKPLKQWIRHLPIARQNDMWDLVRYTTVHENWR